MRIVDRKTFLALPAGSVFAKHSAVKGVPAIRSLCFGEVAIKGDTVGGVDFVVQDLFPWPEDCNDSSEWSDAIDAAFDGVETAPLDFECSTRDGLFDQDQLFAVFSLEDHRRLVTRLQASLDMVEKASEAKP